MSPRMRMAGLAGLTLLLSATLVHFALSRAVLLSQSSRAQQQRQVVRAAQLAGSRIAAPRPAAPALAAAAPRPPPTRAIAPGAASVPAAAAQASTNGQGASKPAVARCQSSPAIAS